MPTGVALITGENVPILTATFKWCVSTRCLADAVVSDANIETLRSQKSPGKLAYKTASQADVSIPVSFNGFGEAIDALQKP
jgi:invasion protein IalB